MTLSTQGFEQVTRLFQQVSGIRLTEAKRQLVIGRLHKLAEEHGSASLDQYVQSLVQGADPDEVVKVVDKLTTNETYFFREPAHFNVLGDLLAARTSKEEFRVWSAASSSGEEAYSIAMLLAERLGQAPWRVLGTDLSTAMVDSARRAMYPLERARNVPPHFLKRFCLKGQPPYDGHLLICRELRERVRFEGANLKRELPNIGLFDVIFLRNVLIYFEAPAKREIVQRVMRQLKPDGLLFTGHAESLANLDLGLRSTQPAVYAHA
jgi:chemotaxis protein methyltransferase CheR